MGLELLAIIALVVTVFVLGGRIRGLERRLTQLNETLGARLTRLESGPDRGAEVLSELRAEPSETTAEPAGETPPVPEAAEPIPPPAADELSATDGPWTPVPPAVTAPPKRFDWERFIGLRLPVWLGAIALSVAGFFFVSYAIESGFFGPEMRVLSAAAASLAFLAGAEFVRRRVKGGNVAAIASALGAASIATAYATAYLATKTYGLVPSGAGFIATIAVSLAAIAIALAYGQVVALVGIVGGYVAPLVYGGGDANAAFLALYVVALTAVSFALIRFRHWWRLSIVGLAGPALWFLAWAFSWQLARETV